MTRKRTLKAGSDAPRNAAGGSPGTHRKAIPDYVIVKLAKTGCKPRAIAKKLGADIEQVRDVLARHDA